MGIQGITFFFQRVVVFLVLFWVSVFPAWRDGDLSAGKDELPTSIPVVETEVEPPVNTPEQILSSGNVDFEDMVYEHYDPERFAALTEALLNCLDPEVSQETFDAAEAALVQELELVSTLCELQNIEATKYPGDPEVLEEYRYIDQVYQTVWSDYWGTMQQVAQYEDGALLAERYEDWQIEHFAWSGYAAPGEEDLYQRETELETEYMELMAGTSVDIVRGEEIFVELVELRNSMAELYGYKNYGDYAYENLFYRDYSPEDSQILWQAAREIFAPLQATQEGEIYARTDPYYYGEEPLDVSPQQILASLGEIVSKLSPELAEAYTYMCAHDLYNLDPGPEAQLVGFTTYLHAYDVPYLLNSPYGNYYDYTDCFHEFGHFANYYLVGSDLRFGLSDFDLSELQSQGMEALCLSYYEEIFGPEAGDAIQDEILYNLVESVRNNALYDEFLQRVYGEEDLTPEKVEALYLELYMDYGYTPYPGCAQEWVESTHVYFTPFYNISYGVSALSALELYTLMETDPQEAIRLYEELVALDTETEYFRDAIQQVGFMDVFDLETSRRLAEALAPELGYDLDFAA
jgi:hypothetical protein